jgi:hypothetical protein
MSNGFFLKTVRLLYFVYGSLYHADTSEQQLNIIDGKDKLKGYKDHVTQSGVPLNRQFCTVCGSNVFINSTAPDAEKKFIIVALGTLDEEVSWRE